ncbi:MAG: FAD-dependent oxidoreductase [Acidobacteriota bacterium]
MTPMNRDPDFLIIGGGIYGATAALELRRRGRRVAMLDPGPLPHPLASSTDISKVVRMEYGTDDDYMALVDEAIDGWHRWNESFSEPLYHETGVTMLSRQPMAEGGFEYESYVRLQRRGHRPQRLTDGELERRFPPWAKGRYVDGFFNPRGGFAESGRVVAALIDQARAAGVDIIEGQTAAELITEGGATEETATAEGGTAVGSTAVVTREGETFRAGGVIVCAGAWTPYLLPELRSVMRATGHPIFHLKPARPELFDPPDFVVFTADVANTGWYGFPLHPREGVLKVANHGVGQPLHPERDERTVAEHDIAELRRFLADSLPGLADAEIVYTRRCLYSDTLDEHLWIDRHPQRPGLTVAAGGSGHAFKMAPLLGGLIADAAEGQSNRWLPKFRWRTLDAETAGQEAARYHG